jgi:hypothetical protein
MSSPIRAFVRRLNLTGTDTPRLLAVGQEAVRRIGAPEIAAAGRWGLAVGLIAFWFIEPYEFIAARRGGADSSK